MGPRALAESAKKQPLRGGRLQGECLLSHEHLGLCSDRGSMLRCAWHGFGWWRWASLHGVSIDSFLGAACKFAGVLVQRCGARGGPQTLRRSTRLPSPLLPPPTPLPQSPKAQARGRSRHRQQQAHALRHAPRRSSSSSSCPRRSFRRPDGQTAGPGGYPGRSRPVKHSHCHS